MHEKFIKWLGNDTRELTPPLTEQERCVSTASAVVAGIFSVVSGTALALCAKQLFDTNSEPMSEEEKQKYQLIAVAGIVLSGVGAAKCTNAALATWHANKRKE